MVFDPNFSPYGLLRKVKQRRDLGGLLFVITVLSWPESSFRFFHKTVCVSGKVWSPFSHGPWFFTKKNLRSYPLQESLLKMKGQTEHLKGGGPSQGKQWPQRAGVQHFLGKIFCMIQGIIG